MERRAFLQLLAVGMATISAAAPSNALNLVAPLAASGPGPAKPSAGIPENVEGAQIEKAYYGHWRRVTRRHYRRVSRRVYRRHHYY